MTSTSKFCDIDIILWRKGDGTRQQQVGRSTWHKLSSVRSITRHTSDTKTKAVLPSFCCLWFEKMWRKIEPGQPSTQHYLEKVPTILLVESTPDLSNMKRAEVGAFSEYFDIYRHTNWRTLNYGCSWKLIIRPCASDSGNQSRAAWQRADTGQTSPRGTVQYSVYCSVLHCTQATGPGARWYWYAGHRYRPLPRRAVPASHWTSITAFLLENTRTESEFDALMICRNTVWCR